jgi:hypothetical protein
MTTETVWNGTREEADKLCDILKRNCACGSAQTNSKQHCAPHAMMLSDQRALDGLLFARHIAEQLLQEEFDLAAAALSSEPRRPRYR